MTEVSQDKMTCQYSDIAVNPEDYIRRSVSNWDIFIVYLDYY